MPHARPVALSLALLFAAGCGSGAGVAPPAPASDQPGPRFPAESSAARHILANVGTGGAGSRSVQSRGESDEDDGGWGELQLPAITACSNGTYATDCSVWLFGGGVAPPLNFCRDAALYPSDLGPSATPLFDLSPSTFSLTYAGRQSPPIVSFATRWWDVRLQGGFAGSSRTAPAVTLTPTAPNAVTRGWLVFFTWSWPADVLLVPYALNEIQIPRNAAPLAVPPNGSATLRAFDCAGRKIAAQKISGGFGFSPDLSASSVASPASELVTPVFGGPAPSGSIGLSDDRGARSVVPVATATSSPGR
jgi:hypothetical protein